MRPPCQGTAPPQGAWQARETGMAELRTYHTALHHLLQAKKQESQNEHHDDKQWQKQATQDQTIVHDYHRWWQRE